MRVLILHGLDGSGPEHWQSWLAGELRERGEDVVYPDLPNASAPRLHEWLAALDGLRQPGDVLVCHSLACALFLHHDGPPAERALLVAPPCRDDIPEIADFFPVPLTPRREALLVCADDDPYCPAGAASLYGRIAGDLKLIVGGGHINPEAGFGPWPWALEWIYGVSKKDQRRE